MATSKPKGKAHWSNGAIGFVATVAGAVIAGLILLAIERGVWSPNQLTLDGVRDAVGSLPENELELLIAIAEAGEGEETLEGIAARHEKPLDAFFFAAQHLERLALIRMVDRGHHIVCLAPTLRAILGARPAEVLRAFIAASNRTASSD